MNQPMFHKGNRLKLMLAFGTWVDQSSLKDQSPLSGKMDIILN